MDWSRLRAWAAPPLGLVPRVVTHVLWLVRAGAPLDLVRILPQWPNSWWWPPIAAQARRVVPLGPAVEVVVSLADTELARSPGWRLAALILRSH